MEFTKQRYETRCSVAALFSRLDDKCSLGLERQWRKSQGAGMLVIGKMLYWQCKSVPVASLDEVGTSTIHHWLPSRG
jgi:hypothetical protein